MDLASIEFAKRVEKLERRAAKSPRFYRAKVAAVVVLGYVTLVALVLFAFGSVGALVIAAFRTDDPLLARLAIIPFLIGIVIARSLWVKFPPPEGRRLGASEAPSLRREVEAIRERLRVPPLAAILFTDEFNAGVVECPRLLGLLGSRRFLVLGVPMLAAMATEQFRAILTHEFGHLSRKHGRFGAWVYRARLSWHSLMMYTKRSRRYILKMLWEYLGWYFPILMSNTFVLARRQEYEADQYAAQLVGAETAAFALATSAVYQRAFGELYWPKLFAEIERTPQPPTEAYSSLQPRLQALISEDTARKYLDDAYAIKTTPQDTHPSLSDRIAALGVPLPRTIPAVDGSATELLGSNAEAILGDFDKRWRDGVAAEWQKRHEAIRVSRERLGTYQDKDPANLAEKELQDYATLVDQFESSAAAEPLYRRLLTLNPDNAAANFNLGRRLLDEKDDAGVHMIELAMRLDHNAVKPGCELLYGYLKGLGKESEAQTYAKRWHEQDELYKKAQQERRYFNTRDRYRCVQLSEEDVRALRVTLRQFPWLGRVYLIEKEMKYFPESRTLVLAVITAWYRFNKRNAATLVQKALKLSTPITVISLDRHPKLRRKFFWMRGSRFKY